MSAPDGTDHGTPAGPDVSAAPEVSVVVPVLDEGATIDELVSRTLTALGDRPGGVEVVIVDDGSTAAERARLRRLERSVGPVRVIELDGNHGQVPALVCGLRHARGRVVVTIDGDLQDPPEAIPSLVDAVGGPVGVATARRRSNPGPAWRSAGSRLANATACRLVGVRLADYGGQFNAYDRPALDAVLAAWRPATPLLPLACHLGVGATEVPVPRQARAVGRSRYRPLALAAVLGDLIVAFGPRGTVPLSVGAAAALDVAAAAVVRRRVVGGGPRPLVVAACVGGALGADAAAAGLVWRLRARRSTAPAYRVRSGPAPGAS